MSFKCPPHLLPLRFLYAQIYGILYRTSSGPVASSEAIMPCAESFGLEGSPSPASVALLTTTIVSSLGFLQHEDIRDASWCPSAVVYVSPLHFPLVFLFHCSSSHRFSPCTCH